MHQQQCCTVWDVYHFKIKLAAKLKRLHLPVRQLGLTLQPPQASMVGTYNEVRTQQVVTPSFQRTKNSNKFSIRCVVVLLRHRQSVGQVLHWQPSLRVIVLLYQRGANSIITGVHPDFMRLILVENLQDWSTGEGFFQLLEGGFFFGVPYEVPVLLRQVGHRLGYGGEALHEPPVEVRQPKEALHLPHTRRHWPR